MNLIDKNELLLQNIAKIILYNPRATMAEIAEKSNISKTTLYRIYGSREELDNSLKERINRELVKLINDINTIINTDTINPNYSDKLKKIIELHFKYNDFLYTIPLIQNFQDENSWIPYRIIMNSFFLNGQKSGYFTIDFSFEFLAITLSSIIFSTMISIKMGILPNNNQINIIQNLFLHGITT